MKKLLTLSITIICSNLIAAVAAVTRPRLYESINASLIQSMGPNLHLWVVIALSIVALLLILSGILYSRYRKLSRSTDDHLLRMETEVETLNRDNDELTLKNNSLQDTCDRATDAYEALDEANRVRQQCLNSLLEVCSDYIDRMERQRKEIARRLRANQYEALRNSVSGNGKLQNDIKDFYVMFDKIILDLFPDFVDRFNELLRPDERITPRDGELNTPLRIYALIRLGVTDSVTIASILHCSPQTVYNNRLTMRNKAVGPKSELVGRVQALGARAI